MDREGTRETFSADIVVVSCGAANSAKLLLASATDKHPNGLSNRSDQLGRNYTFHNSQAVLALSKEENPTVFQKTLGLNDFYFGSDDFEYPLGNIQMVGKSQAEMYRGEKPLETKLAPTRTLESMARHAVDFWLSTEDLPRPENRVTLDRDGRVRLSYTQTNNEPAKRLYHELKKLLAHAGMHPDHLIPRHAYLKTAIPVAGVAHQAGTCRFGTDPATSVLNTDCRAHELDNLYVVDTSFFPSIGAVNPALTAMANALRVGDHLLERLGAHGDGERRPSVPADDGEQAARRRVVIVGGGFGGLAAARKLRHADVDVTLVDRRNHHLFQPLLYQAAAGALSPSDCASPIRPALKRSSNTTRPDGRGHRRRRRTPPGRSRSRRPPRLRQPDRRVRRRDLLLRPRRVEGRHVRAEDARRRRRPAQALLRRLREGRAHRRPGRAGRVADVRRRRRRSHRRGDRRCSSRSPLTR